MMKAGAAPCLDELFPEFAPSKLDIEDCPDDFGAGWKKPSVKPNDPEQRVPM